MSSQILISLGAIGISDLIKCIFLIITIRVWRYV